MKKYLSEGRINNPTEDSSICARIDDLVTNFKSMSPIINDWIGNSSCYIEDTQHDYSPTYSDIKNSQRLSVTLYKEQGVNDYVSKKVLFNGKVGQMPKLFIKDNPSIDYSKKSGNILVRLQDVSAYNPDYTITFRFVNVHISETDAESVVLKSSNLTIKNINIKSYPSEISYTLNSGTSFSFGIYRPAFEDYRNYKQFTYKFSSTLDPKIKDTDNNASVLLGSSSFSISGSMPMDNVSTYTVNNVCDDMIIVIEAVEIDFGKVFIVTDGTMNINYKDENNNWQSAIQYPANRYIYQPAPGSSSMNLKFYLDYDNDNTNTLTKYDKLEYTFYKNDGTTLASNTLLYSSNPTFTYNRINEGDSYQLVARSIKKYVPKKIKFCIYNITGLKVESKDSSQQYVLDSDPYQIINPTTGKWRISGSIKSYDASTYLAGRTTPYNDYTTEIMSGSNHNGNRFIYKVINTVEGKEDIFKISIYVIDGTEEGEDSQLYKAIYNGYIKCIFLTSGVTGNVCDVAEFKLDSRNRYVANLEYTRKVYDGLTLSVKFSTTKFVKVTVTRHSDGYGLYQDVNYDTVISGTNETKELFSAEGKNIIPVYTTPDAPKSIGLRVTYPTAHDRFTYQWIVNGFEETVFKYSTKDASTNIRRGMLSYNSEYELILKPEDIDVTKSVVVTINEYSYYTSNSELKNDMTTITALTYKDASGSDNTYTKTISGDRNGCPDYSTNYDFNMLGQQFTITLKNEHYSYKFGSPVLTYTTRGTDRDVSNVSVTNWGADGTITITSPTYDIHATNIQMTINMNVKKPKLYRINVNQSKWIGLKVHNQDTNQDEDLDYQISESTGGSIFHTWYTSNHIVLKTSTSLNTTKFPNYKLRIASSDGSDVFFPKQTSGLTAQDVDWGVDIDSNSTDFENFTSRIASLTDENCVMFTFTQNIHYENVYVVIGDITDSINDISIKAASVTDGTFNEELINKDNLNGNVAYKTLPIDTTANAENDADAITIHSVNYPNQYVAYEVEVYYATSDITPNDSGWTKISGKFASSNLSDRFNWHYAYDVNHSTKYDTTYHYKLVVTGKRGGDFCEIVCYGSDRDQVLACSGNTLDKFPTYEDALWYVGVKAYTDSSKTTKATLAKENLSFKDFDNHHSSLPDFLEVIKVEEVEDVQPEPEPEGDFVDLGLTSGTLWATKNVGASTSTDSGLYFQWADKTGYADATSKTFNWSSYKYCSGTADSMTKYCTSSIYGTVDNKTSLELIDDGAYQANNQYQIPTKEQWQELYNQCNCEKTTINGVNGWKITNRSDSSKYIFIPLSGYYSNNNKFNILGWYWTNGLSDNNSTDAYSANLKNDSITISSTAYRYFGFNIRAIKYVQTAPETPDNAGTVSLVGSATGSYSTTVATDLNWVMMSSQTIQVSYTSFEKPLYLTFSILDESYNHIKDSYGGVSGICITKDMLNSSNQYTCSAMYFYYAPTQSDINNIITNGKYLKISTGSIFSSIGNGFTFNTTTIPLTISRTYSQSKTLDIDTVNSSTLKSLSSNDSTMLYGTTSTTSTDYVDLDLPSGTLWAKCNVGSTTETGYGLLFQQGCITGYALNDANHGFYTTSPPVTNSHTTYSDGDIIRIKDDAAYWNMGSNWRMPTETLWLELVDNTNYQHTTISGVNGIKFTSKTNSSKYIFLPYAGYAGDHSSPAGTIKFYNSGTLGAYSSSTYGLETQLSSTIGVDVELFGIDWVGTDAYSVRGVYTPSEEPETPETPTVQSELTHIFTVRTTQDFIHYFREYNADNYLGYKSFEHLNSSNKAAHTGLKYNDGMILSYSTARATKTAVCDTVCAPYWFYTTDGTPPSSGAYPTPNNLVMNKYIAGSSAHNGRVYAVVYTPQESSGVTTMLIRKDNFSSSNVNLDKNSVSIATANNITGYSIAVSGITGTMTDYTTYVKLTMGGRSIYTYFMGSVPATKLVSSAVLSNASALSTEISTMMTNLRRKYASRYSSMTENATLRAINFGEGFVNGSNVLVSGESKVICGGDNLQTVVNTIPFVDSNTKLSVSARYAITVDCDGTNMTFYTKFIKGFLDKQSVGLTNSDNYYVNLSNVPTPSGSLIKLYINTNALSSNYDYILVETESNGVPIGDRTLDDQLYAPANDSFYIVKQYNAGGSTNPDGTLNFGAYYDSITDLPITNYVSASDLSPTYLRVVQVFANSFRPAVTPGYYLQTTTSESIYFTLYYRINTSDVWHMYSPCQLKIHSGVTNYYLHSIGGSHNNVYYKKPTEYLNIACGQSDISVMKCFLSTEYYSEREIDFSTGSTIYNKIMANGYDNISSPGITIMINDSKTLKILNSNFQPISNPYSYTGTIYVYSYFVEQIPDIATDIDMVCLLGSGNFSNKSTSIISGYNHLNF